MRDGTDTVPCNFLACTFCEVSQKRARAVQCGSIWQFFDAFLKKHPHLQVTDFLHVPRNPWFDPQGTGTISLTPPQKRHPRKSALFRSVTPRPFSRDAPPSDSGSRSRRPIKRRANWSPSATDSPDRSTGVSSTRPWGFVGERTHHRGQ